MFHNQGSRGEQDPFYWMFIDASLEPQAQCKAKVAAAKVAFGTLFCAPHGTIQSGPFAGQIGWIMQYGAGTNYRRSQHWPDGMWGCVRAHLENLGLSNSRVRIWLTTGRVTDLPIVDFMVDMTGQGAANGYVGWRWNHYKNMPGPAQLTYRYEDNVHIRAGAPVSCAQIGSSGGGGDTTSPAPPSGLLTR
jgi:hypothetical protein